MNCELKDKIWPAKVIACDYCGKLECHDFGTSEETLAENLKNCGWTINNSNAVKCGPCNWKDEIKDGK